MAVPMGVLYLFHIYTSEKGDASARCHKISVPLLAAIKTNMLQIVFYEEKKKYQQLFACFEIDFKYIFSLLHHLKLVLLHEMWDSFKNKTIFALSNDKLNWGLES